MGTGNATLGAWASLSCLLGNLGRAAFPLSQGLVLAAHRWAGDHFVAFYLFPSSQMLKYV